MVLEQGLGSDQARRAERRGGGGDLTRFAGDIPAGQAGPDGPAGGRDFGGAPRRKILKKYKVLRFL